MANILVVCDRLHETDIEMLDAEIEPHPDYVEELIEYYTRLSESEGFDVPSVKKSPRLSGDVPSVKKSPRLSGGFTPLELGDNCFDYEWYMDLAIQQMNKDNAKFVLKRIVKVCVEAAGPLNYYITYEAKDEAVYDAPIKTYQAKVTEDFMVVMSVRTIEI